MNHQDLPDRWKRKLKEYINNLGVSDRDQLNAYDFFSNLVAKIKFDDGSFAEFYYPIVIEAPELNEVGVFTEHCGYHIYNMNGTHISVESTLK
jgi:hypothetical protein